MQQPKGDDATVAKNIAQHKQDICRAFPSDDLILKPISSLCFSVKSQYSYVFQFGYLASPIPCPRLLWGRLFTSTSTNGVFGVVVRCGGFRALYGWLGDVWERVKAHKLPRAGPPDWREVGGSVYVEELLCVLARVPISVDMLRETVRGAIAVVSA